MKKLLASTALMGASLLLPGIADAATMATDVASNILGNDAVSAVADTASNVSNMIGIDGVSFDLPADNAPSENAEAEDHEHKLRVKLQLSRQAPDQVNSSRRTDSAPDVLRIPEAQQPPRPEPNARQVSWQVDNDSWGVRDLHDRYYSSGITGGIQTDETQTDRLSRATVLVLQPMARALPQLSDGYRTYGLTGQHNIYTPERVGLKARVGDRPYAGIAAVHGSVTDANEHYARAVQVTAGLVGPWTQAEEIQTIFHAAASRGDKPVGWAEQLRNEPFVNLSYVAANRLIEGSAAGLDYEVSQSHGATVGTAHVNAHVGVMGKIGLGLSNTLSRQMNDPMVPELNSSRLPADNGVELFGGATVQAVGRNVTLDGNLLQESNNVEKERLVTQAFAGVSMTHQRWSLSYTYNIKSHEFKTQRGDWQHYAGVRLSYRY